MSPARLRGFFRSLGIEQLLAITRCAASIAWMLGANRVRWDRARDARSNAVRSRALARIVALLGELKGVYVKAGQFAAARHDLMPGSASLALAELRDRVPPVPFADIRFNIERELSAPIESLFERIDPVPLGAASIAQVHRATLPGGEEVAVKVQYPWLAASQRVDLAILRFAVWLVARFPARRTRLPDWRRLFAEFENGLESELDFEREARIADEIRSNLAFDPQLALLEILARAYAKQVFVDGLFHADPHPGNLFVIDEPEAARRPTLLFIDFGLSRRLTPQLRSELRACVHALIKRDIEAFVDAMERLGMLAPQSRDAVRDAVAEMTEDLVRRGGALGLQGSAVLPLKEAAIALLRRTPGLQLPNDLLLYAKTLSYVFALGRSLAPDVDLVRISLPFLLQFLGEK